MSETKILEVVVGSNAAEWRGNDIIIVGGMVGLVLLLPAAIYGYLSYRMFDFFRFTYYVPYEEVFAACRSLDVGSILDAPIISANMTSGFLLANTYAVTIQQLLLSVVLGALMGLNLVTYLALRRVCPLRGASAGVAGVGSGLAATISASSTGLLGCCGSALGGGLLTLAGVSSTVAADIADVSPLIQLLIIAVFGASYAYLRWRLRQATASDAPRG